MSMILLFKTDISRLDSNFSKHEFFSKCRDFNDFCHPFDDALFAAAQAVRTFIKQPVIINSSFRTPRCNARSLGSPDSYHLLGKALDLNCGKAMHCVADDITSKGFLYRSLRQCGINGFGISPDFIHIDTRSCGGYALDAVYGPYSLWHY